MIDPAAAAIDEIVELPHRPGLAQAWTDNTIDEKRFRVEIAVGASTRFADLGVVPANSTGARIFGLDPGNSVGLVSLGS